MPTLLATQAISILEAADESEYGIIVRVNALESMTRPVDRARQLLYRFRGELAPRFDHLHFRLSPVEPDSEIWIIKRKKEI